MLDDTAWQCRVTDVWSAFGMRVRRSYFGYRWVWTDSLVWWILVVYGVGRIEFEWDVLNARLLLVYPHDEL